MGSEDQWNNDQLGTKLKEKLYLELKHVLIVLEA